MIGKNVSSRVDEAAMECNAVRFHVMQWRILYVALQYVALKSMHADLAGKCLALRLPDRATAVPRATHGSRCYIVET